MNAERSSRATETNSNTKQAQPTQKENEKQAAHNWDAELIAGDAIRDAKEAAQRGREHGASTAQLAVNERLTQEAEAAREEQRYEEALLLAALAADAIDNH